MVWRRVSRSSEVQLLMAKRWVPMLFNLREYQSRHRCQRWAEGWAACRTNSSLTMMDHVSAWLRCPICNPIQWQVCWEILIQMRRTRAIITTWMAKRSMDSNLSPSKMPEQAMPSRTTDRHSPYPRASYHSMSSLLQGPRRLLRGW